mmetsp:Transcript_25805/g.44460  ORF Transcript_25805/g.44460 Transcript_25805/m.44460 type:complete len:109 (+) Transcript_25805:243-569(+)|eukprot:CAMPEP_0196657982 /NCGR_PEP_ID=MMETSP1086-20130531/26439_1 /TAXON_ID=77921 /ORGANISM="Cyanoptyche  gloeocystis , Strain SAG4.97" /LENGTH=108 /DNA_ID=CAMNT_0041991317 /DNA_START=240 /DNA_END=566 /DNA_ORIENTATION=-
MQLTSGRTLFLFTVAVLLIAFCPESDASWLWRRGEKKLQRSFVPVSFAAVESEESPSPSPSPYADDLWAVADPSPSPSPGASDHLLDEGFDDFQEASAGPSPTPAYDE